VVLVMASRVSITLLRFYSPGGGVGGFFLHFGATCRSTRRTKDVQDEGGRAVYGSRQPQGWWLQELPGSKLHC
jgi:hypothetical protein